MDTFTFVTLPLTSFYASLDYHFNLKILSEEALLFYRELISYEGNNQGYFLRIPKTFVIIMEINYDIGHYLLTKKVRGAYCGRHYYLIVSYFCR